MLSVSISPTNGGSVSPKGGAFYEQNDTITLTATPADGYVFDRWTGDVQGIDDPSQKSVTFIMGENLDGYRSITANFVSTGASSWIFQHWWVLIIVGIVGVGGLFIVLILGWLIFFRRKKQVSV